MLKHTIASVIAFTATFGLFVLPDAAYAASTGQSVMVRFADLDLSKSDVRDAQAFASKQLHLDLSAVLRDPRATVGDLLAVARAASLV